MNVIRISNEKEMRLWNVDALSQQLWGNDVPRKFPVYLVLYQGKPCGFFVAIQQTVVYPAIHPEMLNTRAFMKVVRSLVTEMKRMVGDPIFMLCSRSEEFSARHLKLLRLKRAEENAYVYTEE